MATVGRADARRPGALGKPMGPADHHDEETRMVARRPLLTTLVAGAAGLAYPAAAGRADVASVPAGDAKPIAAAIWRSPYDDTRVWGYVDRHSLDPGQTFDLMLSTGPALKRCKGQVEIYRIGYYPGSDRALIWT